MCFLYIRAGFRHIQSFNLLLLSQNQQSFRIADNTNNSVYSQHQEYKVTNTPRVLIQESVATTQRSLSHLGLNDNIAEGELHRTKTVILTCSLLSMPFLIKYSHIL